MQIVGVFLDSNVVTLLKTSCLGQQQESHSVQHRARRKCALAASDHLTSSGASVDNRLDSSAQFPTRGSRRVERRGVFDMNRQKAEVNTEIFASSAREIFAHDPGNASKNLSSVWGSFSREANFSTVSPWRMCWCGACCYATAVMSNSTIHKPHSKSIKLKSWSNVKVRASASLRSFMHRLRFLVRLMTNVSSNKNSIIKSNSANLSSREKVNTVFGDINLRIGISPSCSNACLIL